MSDDLPSSTRQHRALVVDDSPVIRELIAVNLELEGFVVVCAKDGQEALDVVREVQPDVITLDVVMQRLGGLETVRRLRADAETAHIPVVMVTGQSRPGDRVKGIGAGVEAYLTKPFEPMELVAVVRQWAESGRAGGD